MHLKKSSTKLRLLHRDILGSPSFGTLHAIRFFDNKKPNLLGGIMKHTLLVSSLIMFVGLNVFATSGKTPPSNRGDGSIQCAWYDSGSTEEHGPHITQQECLSSGHGSCQERCFTYDQVCTTEGITHEVKLNDKGEQVVREIKTSFEGRAIDIWTSREISRSRCLQAWPRQDSCLVQSCHEEANRVR